ncbi:MAG: type II toxin-antitoxin system VapC family toxin [Ardenticatenaceae bacterium]|nr:type II toxin-antitoxin system VapC family toxin [Anaerolineales bacterium]MCB8917417.1 type II toxin-antitoxin system VapC family toxin [Ardenticatenaceae bacterium]
MTTYLTIDAGIAFKLIAPHPHQQDYINLVTQWHQADYQLCAPTLWAYEITSTFTKMAHFGHLSIANSRESLRLAYQLGIQLVPPDEEQALKAYAWTERLQRAAAYDSFYLALAETLGCELWTIDKRLVNAVGQPWVRLVEERE